MDPYRELANAIIIQAARDYHSALWALKRNPWDEKAKDMKRDVERFFPGRLPNWTVTGCCRSCAGR